MILPGSPVPGCVSEFSELGKLLAVIVAPLLIVSLSVMTFILPPFPLPKKALANKPLENCSAVPSKSIDSVAVIVKLPASPSLLVTALI